MEVISTLLETASADGFDGVEEHDQVLPEYTDTFLKVAEAGSTVSSIAPASSTERGAHRLQCKRMSR